MVEPSPTAKIGVDVPAERAVEQPGVVDGGIAHTHVAPVDHAGEATVPHEEVRRAEVGVDERRLEADERLHLAEESPRLPPPVLVEERKTSRSNSAH